MPDNNIPIFFIVGRARSGTTLLRCFLDAHENINIPLECAFIIHLWPKYRNVNNWDTKRLNQFCDDLLKIPKFDFWNLDENFLRSELLKCTGRKSYSNICKTVYQCYRSVHDKKEIFWLGDKNPSYSYHIKKLFSLFPEARFIHIIRDYRDNALSVADAGFEKKWFSSLTYRWKFSNKSVIKFKKNHPEIFYTIKYESLVEDPGKYLEQICLFLEIDYHENMVNFQEKLNHLRSQLPEKLINKHHSGLFQPVNSGRVNIWKNRLNDYQVKICDTVAGDFAIQLGYQPKFQRSFFIYLWCIPGIIYGYLLFPFMKLVLSLPFSIRLGVLHFLAKAFKHDWRKFRLKDRSPQG